MLEPVLKVVTEVEHRIKFSRLVSLFLDFDGTLVPIESNPALPRLDSRTVETLQALLTRDFLVTTVISGRAVEDLYSRIRVEGLIYAGNHGLEIFGRNLLFVEPQANARRQELERLCEKLRDQLRAIEGALVECKGLTATVHYRNAAESERPAIEAAVRAAVGSTLDLFRLNHGRKVYEILPRTDWHKGEAARWINGHMCEENILSIYFGDDATDEDAFRVLRDAVTVKVGPAARATSARYRLPDPAAVHEFLLWLSRQEPERAPMSRTSGS